MPRAEAGSTKFLNNKLKSVGLQRLRWYCQVCARQMRDENGFKMHTQSESHVRQMLLVGEDPTKYIKEYSNQAQRDFLQLLRTAHGEKQVHLNHFYQEYIANKEHVHLNATKWRSLTEFAKHLGREGLCRVEDTEKGLHIAWINNSPEALRRQDAIRKKERQDKGDEEREQMLINEQVRKARSVADLRSSRETDEEERELKRVAGEKLILSFSKKSEGQKSDQPSFKEDKMLKISLTPSLGSSHSTIPSAEAETGVIGEDRAKNIRSEEEATAEPDGPGDKGSIKIDFHSKTKNVFAAAKKSAFAGKKTFAVEQPKKVSEAERIMKEELERKRNREVLGPGSQSHKRQRF